MIEIQTANPNDPYNQLLSFLRSEIRGLRKGARLPSFRSLMGQFACSQATVNRVLDVLEEEGLVERRQASGVYVKGSARLRADTVLFVVPDVTVRSYALMVRDGERVARQQGFRTQLFNFRDRLTPLPEHMLRSCRALVLVPRSEDIDLGAANRFLKKLPANLPVVLIDNDVAGREHIFFGTKDVEAGRSAARAFKERGIERVAVLGSASSHISRTRLTGFEKTWGRHADLVIDFALDEFVNRDGLKQILVSKVQGLFISRPDVALQVLCHLEALGARVPRDLFVVSIAEDGDSQTYPCDVVTLVKPSPKVARDAVRAVLAGVMQRKCLAYRMDTPASLQNQRKRGRSRSKS